LIWRLLFFGWHHVLRLGDARLAPLEPAFEELLKERLARELQVKISLQRLIAHLLSSLQHDFDQVVLFSVFVFTSVWDA